VLAFLRCHGDETVLVVANLSRFVQYANLDLSRFRDHVPVELFGLTEFPRIGATTRSSSRSGRTRSTGSRSGRPTGRSEA
jgi:hypothetical protein